MDYMLYYNNVPGKGRCRNNLIYTSLINADKTVFCQHYWNDPAYHKGMNKVVDPNLMQEKWKRDLKFSNIMLNNNPQVVPKLANVDLKNKKMCWYIQGVDFWEQTGCTQDFDNVLDDWQEQMLDILKAYRAQGIWKYSLHPSSYFVVDGKLKSINHFFCYEDSEQEICIADCLSHISEDRLAQLMPMVNVEGLDIHKPVPFAVLGKLALDSFADSYPADFIKKAKEIYV